MGSVVLKRIKKFCWRGENGYSISPCPTTFPKPFKFEIILKKMSLRNFELNIFSYDRDDTKCQSFYTMMKTMTISGL